MAVALLTQHEGHQVILSRVVAHIWETNSGLAYMTHATRQSYPMAVITSTALAIPIPMTMIECAIEWFQSSYVFYS